jgi:hypothetical protein
VKPVEVPSSVPFTYTFTPVILEELDPVLVIVMFVRLTVDSGEVVRVPAIAVTLELPVRTLTLEEEVLTFTVPEVAVEVAV